MATLEKCRNAEGKRYFRGKVRLKDGTLSRITIDPPKCFDEKAARHYVEWAQEDENKHETIYRAKLAALAKREERTAGAAGETCDSWYERFMVVRRREVGGVDDDMFRWKRWISPHIGPKPIREVTPDDVENIRDALTAAVLAHEAAGCMKGEGRLAPKTAQNVWAALTTPMKYASTRKGPGELRVREDRGNPCLGIPPRRNGESKRRHWLRPGEVLAVVSSPAVPLAWREAIAIGCYLHLRPGELHELRVKDLDLASGEVRIMRAYDERKKVVKAPKTEEGKRHVTILATLMPLLERIARERGAEDRVAPIIAATDEYYRAGLFREHLKAAGVERAELYVESPTHLMIDFRSLRDSRGASWPKSEPRSCSARLVTTRSSRRSGTPRKCKGGRYGEPFPSLPADLIAPRGGPASGGPLPVHLAAKSVRSLWAERGTIPRPTD